MRGKLSKLNDVTIYPRGKPFIFTSCPLKNISLSFMCSTTLSSPDVSQKTSLLITDLMSRDEHAQVWSERSLSKKYVLYVYSFYFCPSNTIILRQLIWHVAKCQTGDATLDCHLNADSQCFQFKIYLKHAVYPVHASRTRYTTCVFSWEKKHIWSTATCHRTSGFVGTLVQVISVKLCDKSLHQSLHKWF